MARAIDLRHGVEVDLLRDVVQDVSGHLASAPSGKCTVTRDVHHMRVTVLRNELVNRHACIVNESARFQVELGERSGELRECRHTRTARVAAVMLVVNSESRRPRTSMLGMPIIDRVVVDEQVVLVLRLVDHPCEVSFLVRAVVLHGPHLAPDERNARRRHLRAAEHVNKVEY